MTPTAVIIVNYESGDRLIRCVESVLAQRPEPSSVLVVDNASSDGSITELPSGVQVLQRSRNEGFAAAVLAGLAATDESFVLTLNPDAVLEDGALSAAVSALEADARAGSVALRVLQMDDPSRIDADGIGLTSRFGQINRNHGLLADDVEPDSVTVLGPLGGAALWRRVAIERAGGLDPRYFLYWEDVDLALRLNRAGYECRTVPEARVLHEGSGIVGRWSRTNVFYMVRNHWLCLLSSVPGPLLVRSVPAFVLAPVRAAVLYALRGRSSSALWGLICGTALIPRALLARRHLPRTGTGRKAAERIRALMHAADENRLRMKTAGATTTESVSR